MNSALVVSPDAALNWAVVRLLAVVAARVNIDEVMFAEEEEEEW